MSFRKEAVIEFHFSEFSEKNLRWRPVLLSKEESNLAKKVMLRFYEENLPL